MYKIIRQNSSGFKNGELVHDSDFLQETVKLRMEGATPAVAEFIPNFKVKVTNHNTGEIIESKTRLRSRRLAFTHGVNIAKEYTMGNRDFHTVIQVTEDDQECLWAEIKGR
jgi:hypothetical protein